jgi:hypothetical protein
MKDYPIALWTHDASNVLIRTTIKAESLPKIIIWEKDYYVECVRTPAIGKAPETFHFTMEAPYVLESTDER